MSQAAETDGLPVHEVTCRILGTEPLNRDVTRAWLRLPAAPPIRWYAGQYLELLLAGGACPFSIATAPDEERRDLELHVRSSEDNPSSLEVMAALTDNETIDVRLPGGERYIDAVPQQPVWLICGSTGFAPAKAMIEHLRARGFRRPLRLFWGARTREDLYLDELARDWAAEIPDFDYIPVLSEEDAAGYRSGTACEAALEFLPAAEMPLVHVAGSPAMAWATFDALVAAGVPEYLIHSDVFDYAPR